MLRVAASLEDASEHPIAQAIASGRPPTRASSWSAVESFRNTQGLGVEGVVEGRAVVVGRTRFLADWGLHPDAALAAAMGDAEADRRHRRHGRLGRDGPRAYSWWPTP